MLPVSCGARHTCRESEWGGGGRVTMVPPSTAPTLLKVEDKLSCHARGPVPTSGFKIGLNDRMSKLPHGRSGYLSVMKGKRHHILT